MSIKYLLGRIPVVLAAAVLSAGLILGGASGSRASQAYSAQEIVDSGHQFFGATSGGLASIIETIFSKYGLPNGYVLGEEGAGAIVGGLTYGEGTLYTRTPAITKSSGRARRSVGISGQTVPA